MQTILLISIVGAMNIICFFIGAKVGQEVKRDVPLKVPTPAAAIDGWHERNAERKRKRIDEINMQNIENFDVYGSNQQDFE